MLFYRLSMRFIIIFLSSALISSSICFAQLFPTDSNYYGDFEDGSMSGGIVIINKNFQYHQAKYSMVKMH